MYENPDDYIWMGDPLTRVQDDITHELVRAIDKHGFKNTPMNPENTDQHNLMILVEEVGEVARAMTYDEGSKDNLRAELIQVAAMAMASVIGVDGRG